MITVKNLHKYFGNLEVLKGIDIHIEQGEKIVVIGPSGSGKSTFLRCLNLLETPTKGEIFIDVYKRQSTTSLPLKSGWQIRNNKNVIQKTTVSG